MRKLNEAFPQEIKDLQTLLNKLNDEAVNLEKEEREASNTLHELRRDYIETESDSAVLKELEKRYPDLYKRYQEYSIQLEKLQNEVFQAGKHYHDSLSSDSWYEVDPYSGGTVRSSSSYISKSINNAKAWYERTEQNLKDLQEKFKDLITEVEKYKAEIRQEAQNKEDNDKLVTQAKQRYNKANQSRDDVKNKIYATSSELKKKIWNMIKSPNEYLIKDFNEDELQKIADLYWEEDCNRTDDDYDGYVDVNDALSYDIEVTLEEDLIFVSAGLNEKELDFDDETTLKEFINTIDELADKLIDRWSDYH